MSEFKGTKGKWILSVNKDMGNFYLAIVENENYNGNTNDFYISKTYRKEDDSEIQCANMLLISKAPEHLQELINEIEFLKRIKKQLDELGGSMEFEVEERIDELEQLIKEATELK